MTNFNVCSWPIISWPAQNIHQLQLEHIDSCVEGQSAVGLDGGLGNIGQTLWGGIALNGMVGFAWRWVQLRPGVLALHDPMNIRCNLRFSGADGAVLNPIVTAMINNRIVGSLAWQAEVLDGTMTRPKGRTIAVLPQQASIAS